MPRICSVSFARRFVGLSLSLVLPFACLATSGHAQVSVLTQHNDNNRDGLNSNEVLLSPSNVTSSQFGLLFKVAVDDQIYAQPLYMANASIGGGTHNVVFIATTNNSVYAFDADSGHLYWHRQLGTAFTIQNGGFTCKDVLGTSGIMGTPVIDPSTNTLYVVAQTWINNTSTHNLHGLSISTGADTAQSPVSLSAAGFNSKTSLQRAGLLLANNSIYVTFAGHCDQGSWNGYTLAYNTANLSQVGAFNASPNDNGASIWQSGNGPAADGSGNVYLITGNGTWDGENNFSETFLKTDGNLKLTDWHTPSDYATLDKYDTDLTSSGPLLIPGTNLVIGGGKDGILHLIETDEMGHLGDTNAVQTFSATSSHIHSMNFWNGSLYLWGQADYLRVYSFNGSKFNTTPRFKGTTKSVAHPGASLSLSANGNTNGILWAATNTTAGTDSQGAWHTTVPGILYAYNATDMSQLWTSEQNSPRDSCSSYAKFIPPTIANGKVYLPSFGYAQTASGQLCVYGQLPTTNLIPNGTYVVVDANSGKALDNPGYSRANGTVMVIYPVNNGTNQQWTVNNLGNNIITLTNKASGLALDVTGASRANSALVEQWSPNGGTNQQWRVTSLGDGRYELASVNSNAALDVSAASKADKTQLDQYPYKGAAWQQWTFQAR